MGGAARRPRPHRARRFEPWAASPGGRPGGAHEDALGAHAAVLSRAARRRAAACRKSRPRATIARRVNPGRGRNRPTPYDAEHSRLQAEVFDASGAIDAAERKFQDALQTSRQQGARWLELRAARGYAHHLVEQGRTAEARDLLQPVLAWFTEGRDTMDFLYAEGLLKTLE